MQACASRTTRSEGEQLLIVLDPEDPAATMRTALPRAADTGATLHLLIVYPDEAVASRRRAHDEAQTNAPLSITQLADEAERIAARVGREFLGSDTDFEAMGAVGEQSAHVEAAVRWIGCRYVYLADDRDSPLDHPRARLNRPTRLARSLSDDVAVLGTEDLVLAGKRSGLPVPGGDLA